jgi:hypothetical protein
VVSADRPGDGRGPGGPAGPEEFELRVLLERAVPQLGAPAQRLERIRERVRRRRRRRAAGVCAALVAAVGTAGLLLPGAVGTAGRAGPAAAPPPRTTAPYAYDTPRGSATVPASPGGPGLATTYTGPPSRLSRFGDPQVALLLPQRWQGTAVKDVVYLTDGRLTSPAPVCAGSPDAYCVPLRQPLDPGGTLLVLRVAHNRSMAGKALTGHPLSQGELTKSCRAAGGTEQWYVLVPGSARSGSDAVLTGSACLAGPTAGQRQSVTALLTTAVFS